MEETLESISPLLPIDFFSLTLPLYFVEKAEAKASLKKKYLLPDLSPFLDEEAFAKVFVGYHDAGLVFNVRVDKPFENCSFPEFARTDSIEIFIDTRDLKTAGFAHKFCHHFVIFPKAIDGLSAREITRFRTDDRHGLCDARLIHVTSELKSRHYFLKIFIPSDCLYGYDPKTFDRLGLTYRINRFGGKSGHFAVSSDYLVIHQQPSLWSSMEMK